MKTGAKQIASILLGMHGETGAVRYCEQKIQRYNEEIKEQPHSFNDLNKRESALIMMDFYSDVILNLHINDTKICIS